MRSDQLSKFIRHERCTPIKLEPPIHGVSTAYFLDTNENGKLDPGELIIAQELGDRYTPRYSEVRPASLEEIRQALIRDNNSFVVGEFNQDGKVYLA